MLKFHPKAPWVIIICLFIEPQISLRTSSFCLIRDFWYLNEVNKSTNMSDSENEPVEEMTEEQKEEAAQEERNQIW